MDRVENEMIKKLKKLQMKSNLTHKIMMVTILTALNDEFKKLWEAIALLNEQVKKLAILQKNSDVRHMAMFGP